MKKIIIIGREDILIFKLKGLTFHLVLKPETRRRHKWIIWKNIVAIYAFPSCEWLADLEGEEESYIKNHKKFLVGLFNNFPDDEKNTTKESRKFLIEWRKTRGENHKKG